MDKVVIHKTNDFLAELKKQYPTGLVLGEAYGIVGDFGLKLEWCIDGRFSTKILAPDTEIPITEIQGNFLLLGIYQCGIYYKFFKWFCKRIKNN